MQRTVIYISNCFFHKKIQQNKFKNTNHEPVNSWAQGKYV